MATDKRRTMTSRMNDLISGAAELKGDTERGLQEVGRNIKRNVDQGQKDFKSGKAPYYGTINPLKGTRTAFKKGFGSQ